MSKKKTKKPTHCDGGEAHKEDEENPHSFMTIESGEGEQEEPPAVFDEEWLAWRKKQAEKKNKKNKKGG